MTTLGDRSRRSGQRPAPPPRGTEQLLGYGVMGVPFTSGHLLCLRRFPASSFGPGYTSIWHRAPDGGWTVYTTVAPQLSCPRFLSAALTAAVQTSIEVEWTGAREFIVRAPGVDFEWDAALGGNPITHAMNGLMMLLPGPLWRSNAVLSMMSRAASLTLGAGRIRLRGRMPNRQWYQAMPRSIWTLERSHAVLAGEDFGAPGRLNEQTALADFAMPQRGLFFIGGGYFEALNPERHELVSDVVAHVPSADQEARALSR